MTLVVSTAQTIVSSAYAAKSGELASTATTDTRVGASSRAGHGSFTAQLISQSSGDLGSWLGGLATSTISKVSTVVTGVATFITSAQTYRNAANTTKEKLWAVAGMVEGAVLSGASLLLDDGTTAKVKSFIVYGGGAVLLLGKGGQRLFEGDIKRALALMATGGLCATKAFYDGQELYTQYYPPRVEEEPQGGYGYDSYQGSQNASGSYYGNSTFNELP